MTHFDLVIIGTGSGNSIPGPEFDDKSIAIVEDGLFGGTCLNAGCIPTKMFVHPADLADGIRDAGRLGVTGRVDSVDWPGMRNRIFGRIDAIEAGGRAYRTGPETPNITVFAGRGKFVGPKELRVTLHDGSTTTITGEQWVLAAGSRPVIPDIPGLSEVDFHTSDSIMRLADLPASVTILGGGYIAAEFAHVFASFGCEVTQVVRGPALLRSHDADISAAFTAAASRRYRVLTDCRINKISRSDAPGGGITLDITRPEGPVTVTSQVLLVATGRIPNGADLGVEATGVDLDEDGLVVVDEYQRTKVPGIYALGDISSHWALKHVANHEARVVKHNLAQPDSLLAADHRFVPAAVFTHPQIASVGPTERQLKESGRPYAVKTQAYGDIAAGWAREDTENFLKVLGDPVTGKLLGAHVIGPEAATVIQPLIQAMHFDQTAHQVARGQYWIHPALTELVENALLGLPDPTYSDQV